MSITFQRTAVAPAAVAPATVAPATVAPTATDGVPEQQQRDQAGALLGELFTYLRDNAPAHPALAPAIDLLGDAVAEFRARRPGDPFAGVRAVFAAIQAARRTDPAIPDA